MKNMQDIIMALRREYRKERMNYQVEAGKLPDELLLDTIGSPERAAEASINETNSELEIEREIERDSEMEESETGEGKSEEEEEEENNDYMQRYTDEEHESNVDEEEEVML